MRFQKTHRHEYTDSNRKRAAVVRRQKREQDALPLFAEQIASEQPSVDAVMVARIASAATSQQKHRNWLARKWREQRQRLNRIPEPDRSAVLDHWNGHKWFPGHPISLAGFLDLYERGGLAFQQKDIRQ